MRAAIDTGGTFTDCVFIEDGQLRVLKLFSTPRNPSLAVLEALHRICPGASVDFRHGTTLGTNAMLERRGASVAFVTTAGFEDTIAIGRQNRAELYNWHAPVPICLVPRELRFGVQERVTPDGSIEREPSDSELDRVLEDIRTSAAQAVAISLLFSSPILPPSGAWPNVSATSAFPSPSRIASCPSFASTSALPPPWSTPTSRPSCRITCSTSRAASPRTIAAVASM